MSHLPEIPSYVTWLLSLAIAIGVAIVNIWYRQGMTMRDMVAVKEDVKQIKTQGDRTEAKVDALAIAFARFEGASSANASIAQAAVHRAEHSGG